MSLDLLSLSSTDGHFIMVNNSFCGVLGYTKEELLSQPPLSFVHPEDINKTKEILQKQLDGHIVKNFENRYRHRDGSYKTLSWNSTIDKEEETIYSVARDVTDQRYTENTLKLIRDSLWEHCIYVMTDTKGTITEVNQKFCDISGYSREELLGQTHRLVNSNIHSKIFWEELWGVISSGKTWSGVIENKKKNGEPYQVYSIISPLKDPHGRIDNYLAIRFEVTSEIRLKDSLNKTLSILEETNSIAKVGGWELDVETGELNWTDETFKILEVEKKQGQNPILPEGLELFIPEHKTIIENAVKRSIEFGESYNHEVQALTAKGNKVWVFTNGHAHYRNGKVIRLTGTIQDINTRKLAELSLQLEQSKNLQNAKLATLGELSAGIAHEINNPLTVILGNLSYIEKFSDNPEKLNKIITTLNKSCKRISAITKNLVRHARITKDEAYKPTSIQSIAQESINLANLKAKNFSTTLSLESETSAKILCNEIEIEQVLINLINNSIDATKDIPSPWVKVTIEEIQEMILVKVIDCGTSMTKEIATKLFEPFYTTKEIGEGTGLGLSISKGILEEHNSTIEIDHTSDHTCFVISMPKHTHE